MSAHVLDFLEGVTRAQTAALTAESAARKAKVAAEVEEEFVILTRLLRIKRNSPEGYAALAALLTELDGGGRGA
jgi:hypothetical protein